MAAFALGLEEFDDVLVPPNIPNPVRRKNSRQTSLSLQLKKSDRVNKRIQTHHGQQNWQPCAARAVGFWHDYHGKTEDDCVCRCHICERKIEPSVLDLELEYCASVCLRYEASFSISIAKWFQYILTLLVLNMYVSDAHVCRHGLG